MKYELLVFTTNGSDDPNIMLDFQNKVRDPLLTADRLEPVGRGCGGRGVQNQIKLTKNRLKLKKEYQNLVFEV